MRNSEGEGMNRDDPSLFGLTQHAVQCTCILLFSPVELRPEAIPSPSLLSVGGHYERSKTGRAKTDDNRQFRTTSGGSQLAFIHSDARCRAILPAAVRFTTPAFVAVLSPITVACNIHRPDESDG